MAFTHRNLMEFVKFMASTPNSELCVYDTPNSINRGIACLKTYSFTSEDFQITYNKWYVEDIEKATEQQLFGYMFHDRLAGGVTIHSKIYGDHIVFGREALAIVTTCETAHPNPIFMQALSNGKPSR